MFLGHDNRLQAEAALEAIVEAVLIIVKAVVGAGEGIEVEWLTMRERADAIGMAFHASRPAWVQLQFSPSKSPPILVFSPFLPLTPLLFHIFLLVIYSFRLLFSLFSFPLFLFFPLFPYFFFPFLSPTPLFFLGRGVY